MDFIGFRGAKRAGMKIEGRPVQEPKPVQASDLSPTKIIFMARILNHFEMKRWIFSSAGAKCTCPEYSGPSAAGLASILPLIST